MLGSYRIGSAFGIDLRVHWLFVAMVLLLLIVVPQPEHGLTPGIVLVFLVALFGVVLLHELGHSLVARHFGIRVLDITLWPLGGMARMSEIPENSRVEGLIAIAGPAVNFALAALALALVMAFGLLGDVSSLASTLAWGLGYFAVMNLVLGAFNLLPAFPMDGGRILRAWLGRGGDWLGATEKAVAVGRWLAAAMVLIGLVKWMPMLVLVGVFVWVSGKRELLGVRLRHARSTFFGRDLGGAADARAFAGTPLADLFRAAGAFRARTRSASWGSDAATGARDGSAAPDDAAHRPATPPGPWSAGSGALEREPWTDERLRELERFQGRLRPRED